MPARLQCDEKIQDHFANGFSKKCQAEYEKAFAISVDLQSMKRNLSFALDAIKTVTLVFMTTANSFLMSAQTQSMTKHGQ